MSEVINDVAVEPKRDADVGRDLAVAALDLGGQTGGAVQRDVEADEAVPPVPVRPGEADARIALDKAEPDRAALPGRGDGRPPSRSA